MSDSFLDEALAILTRTPQVLNALLRDLPDPWINATDGPGTWSAYVVIGHLIHAEHADWMPRLRIILDHGPDKPFEPFDREAQLTAPSQPPLPALLDELTSLRRDSLTRLHALNLKPKDLDRHGMHPALGRVTMRQLLATWTAHDLAHLVQINRTLARRYRTEVGPWAEYLSVMKPPQ